MDFRNALLASGLRPRDVVPDGRIRRCPTDDKPRKRNAWYVLHPDGRGAWGDWSDESRRGTWNDGSFKRASREDRERVRERIAQDRAKMRADRRHAAETARGLMAKAKHSTHTYLVAKGFPELQALVVDVVDARLLLVPMYVDSRLVGLQTIDESGAKKFLRGQITAGATFTIGKGDPVWCEGYATGLSVHAALKASRLTRSVVICFSAHNMQNLATRGFVVADNDESTTGQRAAEATGLRYWISDQVGEDFNDYANRVGAFKAAMSLKARMLARESEQT